MTIVRLKIDGNMTYLTYNFPAPMITQKCKMLGAHMPISQIVKKQYDI